MVTVKTESSSTFENSFVDKNLLKWSPKLNKANIFDTGLNCIIKSLAWYNFVFRWTIRVYLFGKVWNLYYSIKITQNYYGFLSKSNIKMT